ARSVRTARHRGVEPSRRDHRRAAGHRHRGHRRHPPPSQAVIRRPVRRVGLGTLAVLLLLGATAAPAAADAPRPTDYRSTITDISPALPAGAALRIVGGDS